VVFAVLLLLWKGREGEVTLFSCVSVAGTEEVDMEGVGKVVHLQYAHSSQLKKIALKRDS